MNRTDYVIFWADDHHPIRILPVRLRDDDHNLGSNAAMKMNSYCDYLKTKGLGKSILWEPTNDNKGSYPALLASDLKEYLDWLQTTA